MNFTKQQQSSLLVNCIRISLGLIFLWAFVDKVFGFGLATEHGKAWIDGVSPTTGFLKFAVQGPFANAFHALAGSAIVDWLFMLGLLGIGVGLVFRIQLRAACLSGIAMFMLMWLAVLPPEHHPFLDEHVVYSLMLGWIASQE